MIYCHHLKSLSSPLLRKKEAESINYVNFLGVPHRKKAPFTDKDMNLEALTQPITKVNYSKEREFGKGAWGELTGYTLNTPCFMIP